MSQPPVRLEALRAGGADWHGMAVAPGTPLDAALARLGLPLEVRCGGRGSCGSCRVELVAGSLVARDGSTVVAPAELRACRHHLPTTGPVRIRVPVASQRVQSGSAVGAYALRAADPPAIAANEGLGIALDVGTTTVVALLIDRSTGAILERAGLDNAQAQHADDVLARIDRCSRDPAALGRLQQAVCAQTLSPLIVTLLAGREPQQVCAVSVAANTTMLHLLAGIDPSSMGVAPFTPSFLDRRSVRAQALGLPLPPATPVELLPGAAAFVGADIVAGILVTGMDLPGEPELLVDVGTNGEIVLRHAGGLLACATAAGPAFEGAGLRCGTRARPGAISHLRCREAPFAVELEHLSAAADAPCPGLCGSGCIDLLAEGRRSGLLTAMGRFAADHPAVRGDPEERQLPLADGVVCTEADIAALLQAKAAIAAGISTVLARAGLGADELAAIHLAGGFGLHLDPANAVACGLLPGCDPARIAVVGNAALAGARRALIDPSAGKRLDALAAAVEVITLNTEPGFELCYIEQMMLPG
ncbi:MAG: ASKHA domain-containing protein [Planctomycetota bacterium]